MVALVAPSVMVIKKFAQICSRPRSWLEIHFATFVRQSRKSFQVSYEREEAKKGQKERQRKRKDNRRIILYDSVFGSYNFYITLPKDVVDSPR